VSETAINHPATSALEQVCRSQVVRYCSCKSILSSNPALSAASTLSTVVLNFLIDELGIQDCASLETKTGESGQVLPDVFNSNILIVIMC